MKRTILRAAIAIIVLIVGYLTLWPTPINPQPGRRQLRRNSPASTRRTLI